MKYITVLCIGIFLLLLSLFLSLEFYKGPFPQNSRVETWRKTIDVQLRATSMQKNTLWINSIVFHNQDKYTWYPPRVIVKTDKNGTASGYAVYGMVTSWDPQARLLMLSSYTGKTLFVLFDPTPNGPIAIMNRFDRFGQVQGGEIQLVLDTSVPNWDTLFCSYDIVSVEAKTANVFNKTSREAPLVPTGIALVNRLCKQ
jgi:hypothetical protein